MHAILGEAGCRLVVVNSFGEVNGIQAIVLLECCAKRPMVSCNDCQHIQAFNRYAFVCYNLFLEVPFRLERNPCFGEANIVWSNMFIGD